MTAATKGRCAAALKLILERLVTNLHSRADPDSAIVIPHRGTARPITCGRCVDRLWLDIDRSRSVIARSGYCRTEDGAGDQAAEQSRPETIAGKGGVWCTDRRF